MFCTGKCGKYNISTSEKSAATVGNFDLNKVSDLPTSAWEKTVTAAICYFKGTVM